MKPSPEPNSSDRSLPIQKTIRRPRRDRSRFNQGPRNPSPSPTLSDSTYTKHEAEKAQFLVSKEVQVYTTFEKMGLNPKLLRGIFSNGFDKPSSIQERCIVPITKGRDVVAQAQSGTGKTAMLSVVSLQLAVATNPNIQVLILSPTRELATQTCKSIEDIGEFMTIKPYCCVGGGRVIENIKTLQKGNVHIVSGTPGRIRDLIERDAMNLKKLKLLCIDEADEMFDHGFKTQVYHIYRYLPPSVQVVLVSATLPPDVLAMTEKFMTNPTSILVKRQGLTLQSIRQFYVDIEQEEWKFDTLCDLFETLTITQAVIFCNTRKKVEWLAKKMTENHFSVISMHGEMMKKDRDQAMEVFRSGKARVLVTSDVWSRGIDVHQVSLVVNYDVPGNSEAYLHRIGRSGRFGRTGVAIMLVTSAEQKALKSIERYYNIQIDELPSNVDEYL